jgi:hypothetical protein
MRRSSSPGVGLLAGMPTAQLQSNLAAAQQAYLELSTGSKVANATYAQGAGSRSVTYSPADMAAVQVLIRTLQMELGFIDRARAPIRPVF